jgi:hypothetical protein
MSTQSADRLAAHLIHRYGLNARTLVVEVEGRAQSLLALKKQGIRVLGIERDVFAMSRSWSTGIDTISAEFGPGTAEYVRQRYGPVALLLVHSVQAETEEFARVLAGASRCLTPDGVLAIPSAGVNAFVEIRPDARPLARAA